MSKAIFNDNLLHHIYYKDFKYKDFLTADIAVGQNQSGISLVMTRLQQVQVLWSGSLNLESETWKTSLHLSEHDQGICSFSMWGWNMVVAVSDWLHMRVVLWLCFCFRCSTSDRPWTTLTSAPCPKPKVSLQLSFLMTI